MQESFSDILKTGGKMNSLGRAAEVVTIVLDNKSRLGELYMCMHDDDAWVRMRAIDSIEKICRIHPEWIEPYVDKFMHDFSTNTQPSIQWHLAQIYAQVRLTEKQKETIVKWLKDLLQSEDIDWIVSANVMDTLVKFTHDGVVPRSETIPLLEVQLRHKSSAVVKRADKLIRQINR